MGSSGGTSTAELAVTGNQLTSGEESFDRQITPNAGAVAPVSGNLRMTNFTARKSETTTQVRIYSGGTAAAATPTLCKIGLYLIEVNGDITLVASTANDTTLFASANTSYTRSWVTPYAKVAGRRYAVGPLVVSGTTMPTFYGHALGALGASTTEAGQAATLGCSISGLADLPASVVAASVAANGQRPYVVVMP